MEKLSKVQIETLRSSKNSKKLTEMSRNEGVMLTPEQVGHVFARKTEACDEAPEISANIEFDSCEKEIAPYGMLCKYKLQVKFVSINGVSACDCRWCGVEFDNDCKYLTSEGGVFYCIFLQEHKK